MCYLNYVLLYVSQWQQFQSNSSWSMDSNQKWSIFFRNFQSLIIGDIQFGERHAEKKWKIELIKSKFQDKFVKRSGLKGFKCRFCEKFSRCFLESAEHVFAIHLDRGVQFQCTICKWIGTRKKLVRHSSSAHKVSLNLFSLEMSHISL